jgi:hypothetical protein
MVASVAYTVTFPLVFVLGRGRGLVVVAAGGLVLSVGLALAGRAALGLGGISLALALSTFAVLAALLRAVSPRALRQAAWGIGRPALVLGALTAACFGVASLLGGLAGALLGVALYAAALAAARARGLREAWEYVRALH